MGDGERIEVVELSPGGPIVDGGASRSRVVVAVLALVVAMAAAALVLVPEGDTEVAVDEEATTTTTRVRDPEATPFPMPIALGAPDDGKESVGLPVRAEPSGGLVDGQSIQVTGTGFPPGESVGVVMCTREAGRDHGARGVEACNLGRFAQTTADADGVATTAFEVARLVVVDGQEIDCASEPQRCLIGMGLISDYDRSGGVLVDFDPTQPLPDPPEASIEGNAPFDDGDLVTVHVDGLRPDTPVGATVCTGDGGHCADSAVNAMTGADGSATFPMRLWRVFPAPVWDSATAGQDVDCALVPCSLQVWGESIGGRTLPLVPLGFTSDPIERTRPVVEERSTGPYRPGDRIEVFVPDHGNGGAEAMLCGPDVCSGGELDVRYEPGGTLVVLTVPSADQGNPCLGVACRLFVRTYPGGDAGEPPPLAAAPIEVVVQP